MVGLYQYVGIFLGIFAIILSILRFREGKVTLNMLALWIFIWVMIIIFSIYPGLTSYFSSLTGIGRGLDFILIIGLIGCYYLIFRLYTMLESIEKEITQLVRELALDRENEKDSDKIDKTKI